jgi:glyoxylase-like metal-dependent hydrolase (beta-lactamase superfamily II)
MLSLMKVHTFIVGKLSANCYVVSCTKTAEAIIIDPGFEVAFEVEKVTRYVSATSSKVKFIVNTHGHDDHISGNRILKERFAVPICIHEHDANCLNDSGDSLSPTNILLEDGSSLEFGRITLKVMHTPGHTLGSISLINRGIVFTGDTLFAGGIGRTDFPGGSYSDMKTSLLKLMDLPDTYVIYPGHGCASTIGKEKRVNPFLL